MIGSSKPDEAVRVMYRALAGGDYPAEVMNVRPNGTVDIEVRLPGGTMLLSRIACRSGTDCGRGECYSGARGVPAYQFWAGSPAGGTGWRRLARLAALRFDLRVAAASDLATASATLSARTALAGFGFGLAHCAARASRSWRS